MRYRRRKEVNCILGVHDQPHCLVSYAPFSPSGIKPCLRALRNLMVKQNSTRMGFSFEWHERKSNEHQQRIRNFPIYHVDMAIGSTIKIIKSDKGHIKNLCSTLKVSPANCDAVESWANERVLETKELKFASRTSRKSIKSQFSDA